MELKPEQQYFYDTAWAELRLAWEMMEQGRKAKAQHHLLEARYFAAKIPAKFTHTELIENIDKLSKQLAWGF